MYKNLSRATFMLLMLSSTSCLRNSNASSGNENRGKEQSKSRRGEAKTAFDLVQEVLSNGATPTTDQMQEAIIYISNSREKSKNMISELSASNQALANDVKEVFGEVLSAAQLLKGNPKSKQLAKAFYEKSLEFQALMTDIAQNPDGHSAELVGLCSQFQSEQEESARISKVTLAIKESKNNYKKFYHLNKVAILKEFLENVISEESSFLSESQGIASRALYTLEGETYKAEGEVKTPTEYLKDIFNQICQSEKLDAFAFNYQEPVLVISFFDKMKSALKALHNKVEGKTRSKYDKDKKRSFNDFIKLVKNEMPDAENLAGTGLTDVTHKALMALLEKIEKTSIYKDIAAAYREICRILGENVREDILSIQADIKLSKMDFSELAELLVNKYRVAKKVYGNENSKFVDLKIVKDLAMTVKSANSFLGPDLTESFAASLEAASLVPAAYSTKYTNDKDDAKKTQGAREDLGKLLSALGDFLRQNAQGAYDLSKPAPIVEE